MNTIQQAINDALAANVARVRRSLVEIRNGHQGAGAGISVRADGLIVTNAHVIGRRGLRVTLPDKRELPAQLIAYDRDHDLALLAVDASDLSPIEFGDSRNLRPGEWVIAIGHPWGVAGAVAAGVVIGSGNAFPEMRANHREWIVTNLRLRPGNSGGPLVDSEGKLVGINAMINGPRVGVAIPVHVVRAFLDQVGQVQRAHQPRAAASMFV